MNTEANNNKKNGANEKLNCVILQIEEMKKKNIEMEEKSQHEEKCLCEHIF